MLTPTYAGLSPPPSFEQRVTCEVRPRVGVHLPAWIGRWILETLTAERCGDDGTWEQVGIHNDDFDLYRAAS